MTRLCELECKPCHGDVPPLAGEALADLKGQLHADWQIVEGLRLSRTFKFKNFADALAFVNRVGEVAEKQQHHPNISLTWGRATVEIWTHKINGLTDSDFILAAKIDAL